MTRQFLLILFLCCMAVRLQAQPRPLIRDVWMNDNRTPLKATKLLSDNRGYLLVGTVQGLYRYNGSTFRLLKGTQHLQITALSLHSDTVWMGAGNGCFGYISNDSFRMQAVPGYKNRSAVNAICRLPGDSTWLGTEAGLFFLRQGQVRHYTTEQGLSDDFIYTLFFTKDRRLLAGTDQGINDMAFSGGKTGNTITTAEQGLCDNITRVMRPAHTQGIYWCGGQEGGLSLYDARTRQARPLRLPEAWSWGQINDILVAREQKVWVVTDAGYLLEVNPVGHDSARVNAFYYPDRKIQAILQDKSGNIWCATGKGLSMLTAEYLDQIPVAAPYTLSAVTAMCCDRNNRLYMALDNEVYFMDLPGAAAFRRLHRAGAAVSVLCADAAGRVWMGTSGDGLWLRQPGGRFVKTAVTELGAESILSIYAGKDRLWVSGLNGVKEFQLTASGQLRLLKTHNKASGIGSDYIYQLFGDRQGRLWMATDGAGVCMFSGGSYRHWNTFDSAGSNVVYTLTEDASGALWAGTMFRDLFRFSGNRWENIRRKEVQDIDVNLSTVNANATGQVMAVYQRCIDVWYPRSHFFRHFNSRHGLGLDSTSRVLNCSARDTSGNVYIPFEKGLLVFRNQPYEYDIRPEVHIAEINNNLKPVEGGRNRFGPGENYLSFAFDGISFTNPERLNYRFRLEGYSDNWVYTNEPSAVFPKLPSGTYTFRVQVSVNGDFDHANEAAYYFTIASPVWKRAWFIAMVFGAAFVAAYLLIRFRDRRMQRLAQLEQERVLFGYEHLKSQVNPHFLFNSLNTLTNLIEENRENAVLYTERLSDLYRNMLRYHDKELIALAEEWEILMAYLYIQQSRFGEALKIKGDIPERLKEQKRIPPMALQLLVENAIKHNVVSLSSPLMIDITADEEEIRISNPIRPKIRRELESGIGLTNIRSRYALLTRRKVRFGKEGENWVVTLPLL